MNGVKVCRQGEDRILVAVGDEPMLILTDDEAALLRALLSAVLVPPPARRTVTHLSDTGRLGHAQDDFARRARQSMLDGRGDAAPRNPAADEGDLA